MKLFRALAFAYTATLCLFGAYAWAQLPLTHAGAGAPGAAAGYIGPGDLISGAKIWYGLRCYNKAFVGDIAWVADAATGTTTGSLLQCNNGIVSASTSPTGCTWAGLGSGACQPIATTCASGCLARLLHDQSGALSCAGAECVMDLSARTVSTWPTYTVNCIGSLPCMTFVRANSQTFQFQLSSPPVLNNIVQPVTWSVIASRTLNFTLQEGIVNSHSGATAQLYWPGTSATVGVYAGAAASAAAANTTVHAFAGVLNDNGTNHFCAIAVDGVSVAGATLTCGSQNPDTDLFLGSDGSNYLDGQIMEAGLWPIAFNSGQWSSMCHNQFLYWGLPTSC